MNNNDDILKVLKEFNQLGVQYLVLRNYENLLQESDVDILLSKKSFTQAKKVLKKYGFLKPSRLFIFPSVINKYIDIKPGCLEYNRCFVESADVLLARKRLYPYQGLQIPVLSKEDELIHLIIKALGKQEVPFKQSKYLKRIQQLFKEVNSEIVKQRITNVYGSLGQQLVSLVQQAQYDKVSALRKPFFNNLTTLSGKFKYLSNRLGFYCVTR